MEWEQIVPNCVQRGPSGEEVATLYCIPALFQNVIGAALLFSAVVVLFFIIFSGIKFITSGGDPKQLESARKTLTYAIIGLVLILFAAFIINLVSFVTGVECIRLFGFSNCS